MVVDYERAWTELQAFVAGKTQHGREGLLTRMAQIAGECRVPSGELASMLRLYGVEVERARAIAAESDRSEPGAFDSGMSSLADRELAGHHDRGGHDGHAATAGSATGARRAA
jgi:hypothetical protein